MMTISKNRFISASFRQQKTARLGGLYFSKLVSLFHSHRCRPNRKLVLKNKDRNNNDKDEGEEGRIHHICKFRPIIGAFENKSRVSQGQIFTNK